MKPLVRAVAALLALASLCPPLPGAKNLHADYITSHGSAAGSFEIMVQSSVGITQKDRT